MISRLEFSCMGSVFTIEAERAKTLQRWLIEAEKRYSRFRTDSDISRLNVYPAGDEWIPISVELYSILEVVLCYMVKTESLFQPFLGAQLKALGYDRSFQDLQPEVEKKTAPAYQRGGILLHPDEPMVKKVLDVEMDLGGFVKGWSVDQIFQMTNKENVFIDGGGDMRFSFSEPQVIGVMNPFEQTTDIAQITVGSGAIATSNVLHRRWQTKNGEYHHILNGQTGENPRSNVVQATVMAGNTAEAEVYAKVLCMMDAGAGARWLKEKGIQAAAMIITDQKQILVTDNINDFSEGVKTAWISQRGNGQELQA
ncbi:FAD:protein FMN transferase [Domibacillus robiginosus]|uniref:FAD:protein FMN transferase n=1 Tax=Domibacillus robiginosus TaxID=1071054 RepID=UPI00067C2B86|nr:FAD:protein FMN transferase [Domibacillus robiginosus]